MSHSGVITDPRGKQVARWVFTDRRGGFSQPPYAERNLASHVGDAPLAVAANRAGLADEIGLPTDRLTFPGLVHGTDTGIVEKPMGLFPNVDILLTAARTCGLVTMGADCVPLLAVDPVKRLALTAHIGWRGAADGIAESVETALIQAGGRMSDTQILLGPAICGRCYSVDQSRFDAVTAQLPAAAVRENAASGTQFCGVDIRAGLAAHFRSRKVAVTIVGNCTAEDPELFSHRRDGVTGRQAGCVVLM